jgi:hypothetical protein
MPGTTKNPKPNSWTSSRCYDWLIEHPIVTDSDVKYLTKKANEAKAVANNASENKKKCG